MVCNQAALSTQPNTSQVRLAQDSLVRPLLHQPVDAPIPPLGRRSAETSISTSAPRDLFAPLHTNVGLPAVGETTQPSPALEGLLPPGEDRNICTPLRRSSFER